MKAPILLLLIFLGFEPSWSAPEPSNSPDAGFTRMYQLEFPEARRVFAAYIEEHPDDPLGQVSLAATYLFGEVDKQGVLMSSLFLNDKKLLGGISYVDADAYQTKFLQANARARKMARARLNVDPNYVTGLFVITVVNGMEADYDALIAKHPLASVLLLHETQETAFELPAVDPDAGDAYPALGAPNYIIGCIPGYKRFSPGLGGIHGSRTLGMNQLQIASQRGHYLKPFAEVMLALVALREKQPGPARKLFGELHREFPENGVFASELAKLQ